MGVYVVRVLTTVSLYRTFGHKGRYKCGSVAAEG